MQTSIDPKMYGGEDLPADVKAPEIKVAEPAVSAPVAEVPAGSPMLGTVLNAQATQMQESARREAAPVLASIGAAFTQSSLGSVYDLITKPSFEPDSTPASKSAFLSNVPFVMSTEEREFIERQGSTKGMQWAVEQIQSQKVAQQAMGDHPLAAGLTAMADIGYFGIDATSLGASKALRLGRAGAAVTAGVGAGALGLAQAQVSPMSTQDIIQNALLNAAATGMLWSKGAVPGAGKLLPKDPEFPGKELQALAQAGVKVEPALAPEVPALTITSTKASTDPLTGTTHTVKLSDGSEFQIQKLNSVESMGLPGWHGVGADAKGFLGDTKKDAIDEVIRTKNKTMLEDAGLVGSSPDTLTFKMERQVKEVNPRPYPAGLEPGVVSDPSITATAIDKLVTRTWSEKAGDTLGWNIHKTMSGFGPVGKTVADLLYDNNANLSIHSIESHQVAARRELTRLKWVHDDLLRTAMAEDGFGFGNQIWKYKESAAHQAGLEREVSLEMLRRDQNFRQGRPIADSSVSPRITKMADALSEVPNRALQELKAAGVQGVEGVGYNPGWIKRVWSSGKVQEKLDALVAAGMTEKQAKNALHQLVADSIANATGMDASIAKHVGGATIDRALRKGAFEDAVFNANAGADTAKVVRDMLKEYGLEGKELQRVMDVLTANADEGGKAGFLKHRMDLDYTSTMQHNGVAINVTDLLDHNASGLMDRYIDNVASQVAFAKKGFTSSSSITALREELVASLKGNAKAQADAVHLFDESVKHLRGDPTGTDMGQALRTTSVINRMISLGASGYWQLTEYATMMGQYGALKSIKYIVQEMPMFKGMLETAATNKQYSQHLKDILTNAADENMRLKPFLQRFEDGFDMPSSASLSMSLQHASQLVPYLNGMKYVHAHQARVTANLILDTLSNAAKGDIKAVAALEKYGIKAEHLTQLKSDVTQHGMQVDKWADGAWGNVRPAFMKMMDESVLHQRMGDMPAFAMLNPVGKFIFTYRGFVLQAHNKILAGGLQRDGFAGVGLMLAYQFPMAAAVVAAQNNLSGKPELSMTDLAAKSVGQMGGVGLGSEVWSWAAGTKKGMGAPGLIPFDRAANLVGDVFKGDPKRVAHDAFGLTPLLSIIPPLKAMEALSQK